MFQINIDCIMIGAKICEEMNHSVPRPLTIQTKDTKYYALIANNFVFRPPPSKYLM